MYQSLLIEIFADLCKLRNVENALLVGTLLRHSIHPIQDLLKRCGHSSMRVLGSVNPPNPPEHFDPFLLATYTDSPSRFPRLYCPTDIHLTAQIIIYDRPHPTRMQYLSLTPISLALSDKTDQEQREVSLGAIEEEKDKDHKRRGPEKDEDSKTKRPGQNETKSHHKESAEDEAEGRERQRKAALVEKLKLHTVISHPHTQKELSLPTIIDQINCSFELNTVLQKNAGLIGRRMKRALSVSERVVESANDLWDYVYLGLCYITRVWVYPVIARLFVIGLIAHRIAGEAILQVLDWRPGSPDSPALKDISATAQQVDIRLQQFCYWPIQYMTLRKRKANWESVTSNHPEYIRFYNSLWLVANDVIIGIALGSYIIENCVFVASQVDTVLTTWSIEGLRRMISWLMEWPGGLKLNTELAEFLGDLFLWVIDHWAGMSLTDKTSEFLS